MVVTGVLLIPSQAAQLLRLRDWFRRWLADQEVPASLHETMVLAAHETAAAEIAHARADEQVELKATLDDHLLTIDVTSGASWLEPHSQEDTRRRLAFIRTLVDEVVILPASGLATIRLYQELARADGTTATQTGHLSAARATGTISEQ